MWQFIKCIIAKRLFFLLLVPFLLLIYAQTFYGKVFFLKGKVSTFLHLKSYRWNLLSLFLLTFVEKKNIVMERKAMLSLSSFWLIKSELWSFMIKAQYSQGGPKNILMATSYLKKKKST